MPCGVAGLVDGGVDQGPWLQERVGRGVGLDGSSKEGGGLGWASPGKGWLAWQFHRRGQGLGGNPRASVPEGQVCYFSKVGGLTS